MNMSVCSYKRISQINRSFAFFSQFLAGTDKRSSAIKNGVVWSRHFYMHRSLAAKISFNLSDIGEGIRDVVVKEWFIKVGDKVSQFDNICEVQSDKASVTITSRYDGIISKLYYAIDDVALVGKPLIDIETDRVLDVKPEVSETSNTHTEEKEIVNKPERVPIEQQGKITEVLESRVVSTFNQNISNNENLCIPSVRRLAKEHNIDLALVTGSGKNGRILKEDVLKYMEKPISRQPISRAADGVVPFTGFQKAMAKTMTESLKIPHFVYSDEIIVTKLSEIRKSLRSSQDVKISFLPFFVKAVSNALKRFPILNASVDDRCENIIHHKNHNIGIAMDTSVGLAVPVIKDVQNLSIMDISQELQRLMTCGKDGTFSPNDLSGGTFAISNIGSIGGTYTKPVILPPQVAIIALGASQVLPRFDDSNNIIAAEIVNISGAADHRIVDGATMARFVKILKNQIESPYLLFLDI